jgi:uncharacterized protein YjdB
LNVSSSFQLTDTVAPNNSAVNMKVSWQSSNNSVATVDTNGLVTAVAPGSAVIIVTSVAGGETASSIVTVAVPVTGVSILPSSLKFNVDSIRQLSATIAPSNATFKDLSWNSSNPDVVTVDGNGKLTGISNGKAIITVTALDGNLTDSCLVTVIGIINGFTVYTYLPNGWTSPEKIFWWGAMPLDSLADGTWPGVNMGTVVNNSTGWYKHRFSNIDSTNLIFDDGSGHQTVNLFRSSTGWYLNDLWYDTDPSRVSSVAVSPLTKTLSAAGATQQLTATISPVYALNKNVSWSSSNTLAATVNSSGLVTAVATGSATIKATTADGGKTASSVITVTINTGIIDLSSGSTFFEIYPNPASDFAFIDYNLDKVCEARITVYSFNGEIMMAENQILNSGAHRYILNINKLNAGTYFVRITSNNFVITKKLIVK